jgi:hypothetical protein
MHLCFRNKYEKKLTKEQRDESIQETLNTDYPVGIIFLFAGIKTAIATLLVVLQSVSFHFHAPYYYYAAGYLFKLLSIQNSE